MANFYLGTKATDYVSTGDVCCWNADTVCQIDVKHQ